MDSIEATVNSVLREWRDLWPGGLKEEQYSTLNLIAHCRHGELGYNYGECSSCHHREWFASSCGNRHCPMCLGPRQAKWSQQTCERLPNCEHLHLTFSPPAELWKFFERNYRVAAGLLFKAAVQTLRQFQKKNWGVLESALLAVLHTWGSALNWHPHLHVLVSSGGIARGGKWKTVRPGYKFPVKAMSTVFAAIFLKELEKIDADPTVQWPEQWESLEQRRDRRVMLKGRTWIVYNKSTLGNTRAVVRYLARYTSRIAISNQRLTAVDPQERTVSFRWKDYKGGGRIKERTMEGAKFVQSFIRHLVPKGLRRIRYYSLLTSRKAQLPEIPGAPTEHIAEKEIAPSRPECPKCSSKDWRYLLFYRVTLDVNCSPTKLSCFSLSTPASGP